MSISNKLSSVPVLPNLENGVWPVQDKLSLVVPTADNFPGRALGSARTNGASLTPVRTHAGIDLFAKHMEIIVAIAPGRIVNFYYFYRSTFALIIDHGDFVVNYGEVDRNSLKFFNLKTPKLVDGNDNGPTTPVLTSASKSAKNYTFLAAQGSEVKAGQPIAHVGKMFRSSMLHIEFYAAGTEKNSSWPGFNSAPPSSLRNGTKLLQAIADPSLKERVVEKELNPKDIICS